MARLRIHFPRFIAIVAMGLCIATISLWARSYWWEDRIESGTYDDTWYDYWFVASTRGRITVQHQFIYGDGDQPPAFAYFMRQPYTSENDLPWTGFIWKQGDNSRTQICFAGLGWERQLATPMDPQGYRSLALAVPDWLIVVMMLVVFSAIVKKFLRRRKFAHSGICAVCGYDLRATPNRCPECGDVKSSTVNIK